MGEPFRDPMSAAALRLEQLASENKLLREELDALRRSVVKKQPATSPDVQALADRTLELLERLDANI